MYVWLTVVGSTLTLPGALLRSRDETRPCRYLVTQGCIKPLCNLLMCNDPRLVTMALEGIENVLKAGEREATGQAPTSYTTFIYEAEGVNKLKHLQLHDDEDVVKRAAHILETYSGRAGISPDLT